MKLKLRDSKKTMITSFETEVERKGDWNEVDGYHYIINVNGLVLKYTGPTAGSDSQKDLTKMYNKGAAKVVRAPYISEEEEGWALGVESDCKDPSKHGHVCYTILAGEQSGCWCWDYYKQTVVLKENLTKV